jgi:hypothetical protein
MKHEHEQWMSMKHGNMKHGSMSMETWKHEHGNMKHGNMKHEAWKETYECYGSHEHET